MSHCLEAPPAQRQRAPYLPHLMLNELPPPPCPCPRVCAAYSARVREWAVATLGKLIPAMPAGDAVSAVAARSTEALRPLLEDEDRRCRERAGALTQAIAKLAAAALPSQSEGGNDNDDDELPPLE